MRAPLNSPLTRLFGPIEPRSIVVTCVLAVVALAAGFAGLCYGTGWDSPAHVLAALSGDVPGSLAITEWRAPRVVGALLFGAALALAGAIFQNVTRNALGSPDVIGLDTGSYTGVLLVLGLGLGLNPSIGAVVAGLTTAIIVYALSFGSGFSGLRLVISGIGINAMLTALNSWIILRADLDVAMSATAWSAGNLGGLDWGELVGPVTVIGGLTLLLVLASHAMHQAALGEEVAATTGVGLGRHRLLLVVIAVGLTATVTAVAGLIVFISLVAPQIARRLVRTPGVPLLSSALVGAALLAAADIVSQTLLAPTVLPVGSVTTAIGGVYLLWLLGKEVTR